MSAYEQLSQARRRLACTQLANDSEISSLLQWRRVDYLGRKRGRRLPIGMIILSPFAKGGGYFNTIHYTHSATLQTLQKIFGVAPFLGDASNGPDLSDLFVDGAIPKTHR